MNLCSSVWNSIVLLGAAGFLAGCAAKSDEIRYFATVDSKGDAVNHFRLTVKPRANATNARYISGFYDERAIDLFLNEHKVSTDKSGSIRPFFPTDLCAAGEDDAACKKKMDDRLRLVPVGASGTVSDTSRFVMILSSNAGAVSDTIGSFASNENVLSNLLTIVNREPLRKAAITEATAPIDNASRAGVLTLVEEARKAAAAADSESERNASYLLILQTIARETGARADFTTLDAAGSAAEGAPR